MRRVAGPYTCLPQPGYNGSQPDNVGLASILNTGDMAAACLTGLVRHLVCTHARVNEYIECVGRQVKRNRDKIGMETCGRSHKVTLIVCLCYVDITVSQSSVSSFMPCLKFHILINCMGCSMTHFHHLGEREAFF